MTKATVTELAPIWHPFTQMKTAPPPLKVKSGHGVYLELEDGRQIIDCISSWWVNLHGHANPIIARAISEQAQKLEHVIFAGFTHEPAEKLATRLLAHLPKSCRRVFYSDNGSTAVEVAVKMSYQYWLNRGETRTRFIGFAGGYHGDTLGAMSVGRSSPFWKPFQHLMFETDMLPFPETFDGDGDDNVERKEKEALAAFYACVDAYPQSHAALIIEPLVQGVGGMRMCRPIFLQQLEKAARELGVIIIYDEVMTGFGRTGDWFACTKANTAPDLICLSKGITGGFLPLAATIATEEIFSAFYSDEAGKTFLHGHSYTANPLACAAALASLDLLEANPAAFQSAEQRHREKAHKYLEKYLQNDLADQQIVRHARFCGDIAAFDVTTSDGNSYFDQVGQVLRQKFIERGVLIRPLGNTVYLMPPYCITDAQLDSVYLNIQQVLDELSV